MKLKKLITEAVLKDSITQISEELTSIQETLNNRMLTEGVDDPGILKCVFMAGGAGSGKGFVSSQLFGIDETIKSTMAASGLKVVGSDVAFEALLKKNGINPKDLAKIEKESPELWDKIANNSDSIRNQAKAITANQKSFYEAGRIGVIIDGTGHDLGRIAKMKKHAEELGYDTTMVFVNTSLEIALLNNQARTRTLADDIVKKTWYDVQNNLGKFQSMFGGNFSIVDNTDKKPFEHIFKNKQTGGYDKVLKPVAQRIHKLVSKFVSDEVRNPIGKNWILTARALKKVGHIK
jgi:predicted kinase